MTQFARPDADVTAGGWSPTPLWPQIDETTRDDADVITSDDNTSPDVCEVALSDVSDPQASDGHTVGYAYRKNSSGGHAIDVTVRLMQGTTEIAAWTHTGVGDTFTEASQTLTQTQADAISDYTDLRLRFERAGDTGGNPGGRRSAQVSWAELAVPDATAVTHELSGSGDSEATAAGTLTHTHEGSGDASVEQEASGGLVQTHRMSGKSGPQQTAGGDLAQTHDPSGTAAVEQSASGALTVISAGAVELSGTARSEASASGTLVVLAGLSGAALSQQAARGALRLLHDLAASGGNVTSASAVLTVPGVQTGPKHGSRDVPQPTSDYRRSIRMRGHPR